MQDLLVLELIIVALLFLAIVRPFVKSFQGIDGIAALPAIALIASIAVFPAFGFRPEFFPLAVLALLMFLGSIPRLVDVFRRLRTDDYGERGFVRLTIGLLFLAAAVVFAIAYGPRPDDREPVQYREALIQDEIRDVSLSLRYYIGPVVPNETPPLPRPIVLVAPPIFGSVAMTDFLCAALAERGFFVGSFSRVGTDFPAYLPGGRRVYPRFDAFITMGFAFVAGRSLADAARAGAMVERERAADLAFLVKHARSAAERGEEPYTGADPNRIVVAGFGVGGAGATIYAASAEASLISAAAAVEGPLLSALQGEGPLDEFATPEGANGFSAWAAGLFGRFRVERIIGTGAVPAPIVPTLFLVSDQAREPEARDERYAVILRSLRTAKAPSVLASMDGAGPFDYSDVAEEYPVYSAVMSGLNERSKERDFYLERTATLIANFVDTVAPPTVDARPLRRSPLGDEIRLEAGGPWTRVKVTDILRP